MSTFIICKKNTNRLYLEETVDNYGWQLTFLNTAFCGNSFKALRSEILTKSDYNMTANCIQSTTCYLFRPWQLALSKLTYHFLGCHSFVFLNPQLLSNHIINFYIKTIPRQYFGNSFYDQDYFWVVCLPLFALLSCISEEYNIYIYHYQV